MFAHKEILISAQFAHLFLVRFFKPNRNLVTFLCLRVHVVVLGCRYALKRSPDKKCYKQVVACIGNARRFVCKAHYNEWKIKHNGEYEETILLAAMNSKSEKNSNNGKKVRLLYNILQIKHACMWLTTNVISKQKGKHRSPSNKSSKRRKSRHHSSSSSDDMSSRVKRRHSDISRKVDHKDFDLDEESMTIVKKMWCKSHLNLHLLHVDTFVLLIVFLPLFRQKLSESEKKDTLTYIERLTKTRKQPVPTSTRKTLDEQTCTHIARIPCPTLRKNAIEVKSYEPYEATL